MSSFFIYNSWRSIDENALNILNLIINLAKDIQTKSNNNSDDSANFPSFSWIVRDKINILNITLNENKWLNDALLVALQQSLSSSKG